MLAFDQVINIFRMMQSNESNAVHAMLKELSQHFKFSFLIVIMCPQQNGRTALTDLIRECLNDLGKYCVVDRRYQKTNRTAANSMDRLRRPVPNVAQTFHSVVDPLASRRID